MPARDLSDNAEITLNPPSAAGAFSLRVLGRLELVAADGRSVNSLLAQPKRLALLVYLALARPRGYHARDILVGLLWPETDEEAGRNALRQALHFIRRSMDGEAVQSRGAGELGVNPDALECDVWEFDALLRHGRQAEAMALYGGELLRGLYVPDAPEFERWLEQERHRLREAATAAAWNLCEAARVAGDADAMRHWANRAVEIDPHNERSIRRLFDVLDLQGDRASALRAYEEFARQLRLQFDQEPSAETQARIAAVREREEVLVAAAVAEGLPHASPDGVLRPRSPAGAAERPAPMATPAPAVAAAPPAPPPGRGLPWRPLAIGTMVLVGLAFMALALARWPRPVLAPVEARVVPSVAVFPVAVNAGDTAAYLRDGLADLLTSRLHGAGALRAVEPAVVAGALQGGRGDPTLEPSRAAAVARRLGAEFFLLGRLFEADGRTQLTASMYRTGDASSPVARAVVEGNGAVFLLTEELSRRLLSQLYDEPAGHLARAGILSAGNFEALKAFLRSEDAFRRASMDAAVLAAREALAADSSFALARYRLATAAAELGDSATARAAARLAVADGARLGAHERRILEAFRLRMEGETEAADRLYREALSSQPDAVEAWYMRGDILLHSAPLLGRSMLDAHDALARARHFDRTHGPAIQGLLVVAARAGRTARFDSLLATAPPGVESAEIRALAAVVRGDSAAFQARLPDLASLSDARLFRAATLVATAASDSRAALQIARLLSDPARSAPGQQLGLQAAAALQLGRGRRDAARAELVDLSALDPAESLSMRALYASLPFVPAEAGELADLHRTLLGAPADEAPGALSPARRMYLLGLIEARLGRYASVTELAERLAAERDPAAAAHAALLRALVARAAGQPAEALASLPRPRAAPLAEASPFAAQTLERFLRAELLRELGRSAEAARWYAGIGDLSVFDSPFRSAAQEWLARLSSPHAQGVR